MADYVPSAIIVGGAIVTVGIVYALRAPLFLLFTIAILALFLVLAQHKDLFSADYRSAQILGFLAGYAPFLIVGAVILFALFYIFFMTGTVRRANTVPAAVPNTFLSPTAPLVPTTTSLNRVNVRNNSNYLAALERAI
jgi:hypothetical protein